VWEVQNAATFPQGIFCPYNHVCVFALVHGLLEFPRIFGLEPILGRWWSILWEVPTILRFRQMESNLCRFSLHFWRRIFWAHSKSGIFDSRRVRRFYETLLYYCYTLTCAQTFGHLCHISHIYTHVSKSVSRWQMHRYIYTGVGTFMCCFKLPCRENIRCL